MGRDQEAWADADYVLRNVEEANGKALFRRAVASKRMGKVEDAVRDLQVLWKQDTSKKDVKKELDECLAKLVEMNKSKQQAA